MSVIVTFTLKTDVATYQALHSQLLAVARPAGLLFHASYEAPAGVAIVDFWPTAEAFQSFMGGPAGEGLKAQGIPAPDDLKIMPVLNAGA